MLQYLRLKYDVAEWLTLLFSNPMPEVKVRVSDRPFFCSFFFAAFSLYHYFFFFFSSAVYFFAKETNIIIII